MQARVPVASPDVVGVRAAIVSVPRWCLMISCAMARPRPVPSPSGFVVKNGSSTRAADSAGMPLPLSVTSNATLSASRADMNVDAADAALARVARVQEQIHERLLQEARLACDRREVFLHLRFQHDPRLREAMLDELRRLGHHAGRIHVVERGRCAARERKEPANDTADPLPLLEDRLDAATRAIVTRHFRQELLGAPDDDAQRRRYFVRDPGRECAEGRQLVGAKKALVAHPLRGRDRDFSHELELLSLISQRDAAEREHEPAAEEHAEHENFLHAKFAVAFALRGRDDRDVPHVDGRGPNRRHPRDRHARGEPEARRGRT